MLDSIEQHLRLLSEFESLPKKLHSESIFDIAGYPNYENVASNILAFFLNPHNGHNLGQLVLSSLLNLAEASEAKQSNVQVRREVYTKKGGRIDILVETDNHLIGIENKIYHRLDNNLEDYGLSLEEWADPNQLAVAKIVLSLERQSNLSGFKNITYEELFSKINERLGFHVTTSSQKWILYLIDFMHTVKRLAGSNMEFDDIDTFFIKNEDRVNSLIEARNKFMWKLNSKVIELKELIGMPSNCDRQWIYAKSCLVHDFRLFGSSIAFDLYLFSDGWELQAFGRNRPSSDVISQVLAARSDVIGTTNDNRRILARWPISTDLEEIKKGLCEWMNWIIQEVENNN
jgi:hypothetical protein